jgi:exopolyphosphatase/guanosine-5'-triphosphate,3'-diphosphate pyrophosphatase
VTTPGSPRRVAAVDIGTNSVLLLVAEERDGRLVALADRATITRLGAGVDQRGELDAAAIERTLACLRSYRADIDAAGVAQVAAVGTSAMRDAQNGEEFRVRVAAILGVAPEVVSGRREAQLTFDGAFSGLDATTGAVAVFDIGGGSTEIITGVRQPDGAADGPRRIEAAVSLDVGAVRMTERHLRSDPPTAAELASLRADVEDALARAPDLRGRSLVGVAGTMTTLAAMGLDLVPYDGTRVHGSAIARGELDAWVARLAALPLVERRALRGLGPARADVLVAGALIAQAICAGAEAPLVTVSDRGVRWGVAQELARGG